jgi:hypothetical protein
LPEIKKIVVSGNWIGFGLDPVLVPVQVRNVLGVISRDIVGFLGVDGLSVDGMGRDWMVSGLVSGIRIE